MQHPNLNPAGTASPDATNVPRLSDAVVARVGDDPVTLLLSITFEIAEETRTFAGRGYGVEQARGDAYLVASRWWNVSSDQDRQALDTVQETLVPDELWDLGLEN